MRASEVKASGCSELWTGGRQWTVLGDNEGHAPTLPRNGGKKGELQTLSSELTRLNGVFCNVKRSKADDIISLLSLFSVH